MLQASASDDGPPRPPWHWAGIGAALVFAVWAPLAMLAQAVSAWVLRRSVPEDDRQLGAWLASASALEQARFWGAVLAFPLLAFALACFAAGALVGRFGGRAGAREATAAGALAAALAWSLAAALLGSSGAVWNAAAAFVVLVPTGALVARGGARWGERRRAQPGPSSASR